MLRDRARAGIWRDAVCWSCISATPTEMSPIREVWAPNLELEIRNIRDLIDNYPFVALVRPSAANPQPRRILTAPMLLPGH